jgi:hypothetical protein
MIESDPGPLSRMTAMALRPVGVPNATIVSITAHSGVIRRVDYERPLRVAFL